MSDVENLTVEILRQIHQELQATNQQLDGFREDVNARLDLVNTRLDQLGVRVDNVTEMQNVLVLEHRKTNQRLEFFAEEMIRMRTRDNERLTSLETAVAELQRKIG